MVGIHTLSIEIEDIYFLTGLSRRENPVVLSRARRGETSLDDLIDQYCALGRESQFGKLRIQSIVDCPLMIVVYTIEKVAGTRSSHLTTRSHMLYDLQCMEPTAFNWCEGMLVCLKDQLNKCKRGTLKQFGYGTVIVSFILQRVPHMRPQVNISRLDPKDPRMLAWVMVMPRNGGGGTKFSYGYGFFCGLRN